MHATVVMLAALSSLGCQNKDCDLRSGPLVSCGVSGRVIGNIDVNPYVPSSYPSPHPSGFSDEYPSGYPGGVLRATLWSFLLGHDPDVPTAREIEESFDSGRYAQAVVFGAAIPPRQK